MRRVLLTGGPDVKSLRVIDADTGKVIDNVVKVELLCVPDDGALINITQACRVAALDVTAIDAGVPLVDLPDDHPEVPAKPVRVIKHDAISEGDKQFLREVLTNQPAVRAPETKPSATLAPRAPWPFPPMERR